MKLIFLIFILFFAIPLISCKIFPLQQLKPSNFLNRKPIEVHISSESQKLSFLSFISRNSRGILFDLMKPELLSRNTTNLLQKISLPLLDDKIPQALLDFRLFSHCKFSKISSKMPKILSFSFEMSGKDSGPSKTKKTAKNPKNAKNFKVEIVFLTKARSDLLLSDVKEFSATLHQLRNACKARKNQLRSRRDWFIEKADKLYENMKKIRNSDVQRQKFLDSSSLVNIDTRVHQALASHAKIAGNYQFLRKKAQKLAWDIAGFDQDLKGIEKNRAEGDKETSDAKREVEAAKLQSDLAKTEWEDARKTLVRAVPEARKVVNEAFGKGEAKDHGLEIKRLVVNST